MVSFYNYRVPPPRLPPQLPPCPAGSPLLFPGHPVATAQPATILPATGGQPTASPLLRPGPLPLCWESAPGGLGGFQHHLGRWRSAGDLGLVTPTSKEI